VLTHQLYAESRKIDPATATAVAGPWRPRSVTSSGSWSPDDLRAECVRRAGAPVPAPEPEPEPDDDMEDDEMRLCKDSTGSLFGVSPGFARFALWAEDYNAFLAAGAVEVTGLRDDTIARMPTIGDPVVTKPILE
jgi:hypothetical protein